PGSMPTGPVGLQEWAQYQGQDYRIAGSGFLFALASGEIVAATTAHSVRLGDPDQPLEWIALGIADRSGFVGEFETLRGKPGQRLTPENLTVDYLLLEVDQPVDPDLVLVPDPRGAPQPGERVSLYSGLGEGQGNVRVLSGTVQSAGDDAVWVLMDGAFNPGLMSGSPLVSQHTGQVVGMAVAASRRINRLLIGIHPIGSLVRLAGSATESRRLIDLVQEAEQ
ncbi:MAG: hypothetical protein PVI80_12370, partial [Anaerolineae bacterium]